LAKAKDSKFVLEDISKPRTTTLSQSLVDFLANIV